MKTIEHIIKKYNLARKHRFDHSKKTERDCIVLPDLNRDELVKLFKELDFKVGAGHDFSEKPQAGDVLHGLKAYIDTNKIDPVFVLGKKMTKNRDFIRSWFL